MLKIEDIKMAFLEMLKEGEKISRIYKYKEIDDQMLKYATVGARNFLIKFNLDYYCACPSHLELPGTTHCSICHKVYTRKTWICEEHGTQNCKECSGDMLIQTLKDIHGKCYSDNKGGFICNIPSDLMEIISKLIKKDV